MCFVEEARSRSMPVLVHCFAGVSRSPAVVIAYLMATKGWDLEEAHEYVKERRAIIKPNSSFIKQLVQWEVELQSTRSTEKEKDAVDS